MGRVCSRAQEYHHHHGCSKWLSRLVFTLAAVGISFAACKIIKELKDSRKVRYSWRRVAKSRPLFPRYAHSLTSLKFEDGAYPKVFVIGGDGIVADSLDVHVLDQALTTWRAVQATCEDTRAAEATLSRRWSHTASGIGRSIFLFGGHVIGAPVSSSSLVVDAPRNSTRPYNLSPTRETAELLEFDVENFIWSVPSPYGRPPCARCSHTATVVGTKIFVFGGYGEGVPLNDVHIFDTFLGTWMTPKVIGTPPSPRCSHSACVVDHGRRILIYGGYGSDHQKDIWFLEVNTPFVRTQEEMLGGEVVAWSQGFVGEVPQPVVLCGPSGVGKSSLIRKLIENFPDTFGFSVSHTTRPPREQEVHGVHYHFTTREVMDVEIEEGKFLEYAEVHGNLYGTSLASIEAVANSHKRCILDIDVQGARLVKHSSFRALFIFISPPSYEELENRLRGRGTETEADIVKWLRNAKAELHEGQNLWLFDHVIINENFETTYQQLKKWLDLDCSCSQLYNSQSEPCRNRVCSYCRSRESKALSEIEVEEPAGRSCHTAVAFGNRTFIYGGIRVGGTASGELLVLDLAQSVGGAPCTTRGLRWLACQPEFDMLDYKLWSPRQLSKRYNHQAAKISADEMLIMGGFNRTKALADSFVIKVGRDT